jgi:nicotinamidase/pyrazinamidase
VARYDRRTALVVVDVQNDFADPKGSLYVTGGEQVVEAVNAELAAALQAGATIVYTQDCHPPDTPHFEKDGGVWPVHCVAGTWGAELHPALRQVDGAVVVSKGTTGDDGYSAFSERDPETDEVRSTGLEDTLVRRDIERLVVVGLATDYCVKETVLDARRLDLPTEVLTGAIAAVDLEPGDGARALEEMRSAGAAVA